MRSIIIAKNYFKLAAGIVSKADEKFVLNSTRNQIESDKTKWNELKIRSYNAFNTECLWQYKKCSVLNTF
jgi:hypothetical protein